MKSLMILFLLLPVMQVSAAPPFSGTVFVDQDLITNTDPSTYVDIVASGNGMRTMFDRRVNDWITVNARLYEAIFTDHTNVEVQVNPEFSETEASAKAAFYAHAIGQLPTTLKSSIETVWIHKGDQAFGGGNNNILIHTDSPGYHGEWLEETLFHEASHTSLDAGLAASAAWRAAQGSDPDFISTYARDNPDREDVAESALMYFGIRYRQERMNAGTVSEIEQAMPARIKVFDGQQLKPITAADAFASFNATGGLLQLPSVMVGAKYYSAGLTLTDPAAFIFTLATATAVEQPSLTRLSTFSNGLLAIPLLVTGTNRFSVTMKVVNNSPLQLQLSSYQKL